MTPTAILAAAKDSIPFYFLGDYIDNLKADGDFSKAGLEHSLLKSAIDYFASQGNPNKIVSVDVPAAEEEETQKIDFPTEFESVIQIRDKSLQSVPYEIDSDNSKIVVIISPEYVTPYEIRYRYGLSGYFVYHVDGGGNIVVDTDKDISQATVYDLIKRYLITKLTDYNNKISEVSRAVQMDLPVPENQGEKASVEDEIKGQVRIQPSLMSI